MANVLDRWDLNPGTAKAGQLTPYVTASTVREIVAIYEDMSKRGLAYRGHPDTPHVRVVAADTSSAALTDCPTPATTNPSVQYVVATGKPVLQTGPRGLHPKAVTVLFTGGHWRVNSIVSNPAKTCTP